MKEDRVNGWRMGEGPLTVRGVSTTSLLGSDLGGEPLSMFSFSREGSLQHSNNNVNNTTLTPQQQQHNVNNTTLTTQQQHPAPWMCMGYMCDVCR